MGIFLYAITLRHGWGVEKDEEEAVRLLQVAANQSTGHVAQQSLYLQRLGRKRTILMQQSSKDKLTYPSNGSSALIGGREQQQRAIRRLELQTEVKQKASITEVVMAIFELAMSFKMGWGVPKNKVTAVYYLNMAAELGDPDAQVELGECYFRGDGIKANKKMAAHWFRKAEKQGVRLVQMQWIWKDKYDLSDPEINVKK